MTIIKVFLDSDEVFSHEVITGSSRSHLADIVKNGYLQANAGVLTHFPAHRIIKVTASASAEKEPDTS